MRPSHLSDEELVTLPAAAKILGVHRATVNDMVLSRRLRARRRRGHWYIAREDLDRFAASYSRPPNALPGRGKSVVSSGGWRVLELLVEWGDATVAELDRCVDLHEGNIRKQLRLLESEGLARRVSDFEWAATGAGRRVNAQSA